MTQALHKQALPKRDEAFRAGETALLLVDMQRIWLEPGADPSHLERGPDHYFYRKTSLQTIPTRSACWRRRGPTASRCYTPSSRA